MKYVSLFLLFLILSGFTFRDSLDEPIIKSAAQDQMEAGTVQNRVITPSHQQYHPSAAKAWVVFDMDPSTIHGSYNVSSITDNGIGDFSINFTVEFSSANYSYALSSEDETDATVDVVSKNQNSSTTSSSFPVLAHHTGGSAVDESNVSCVFFGDQ